MSVFRPVGVRAEACQPPQKDFFVGLVATDANGSGTGAVVSGILVVRQESGFDPPPTGLQRHGGER